MGYYISEGTLQNNRKNSKLALYAKREKILEDMRYCIKKIVGSKPWERVIDRGFGESNEVSFCHKIIIEFIEKYCGKGSKNKRIPDFIFGLSKERIGQFLSGLYAGDGCFTKNYYGYYTISEKLASDVVQLLNVYGIVASVRERKRRENKDFEILFYRYEDKKEFLKYVNPLRGEIPLRLGESKNLINDVYVDTIYKIEEIKLKESENVYDISVPGNQNFIGGFGGIMLHNSGHPSLGTMHAEDVQTMIRRLETPPINLSPSLVESLDAVCIIAQIKRGNKNVRKIKSVVEIINVEEKIGSAKTHVPFIWDPAQNKFFFQSKSRIFDKLIKEYGVNREKLYNEFRLRTLLLMKLYQAKITGFKQVQDIITAYYKTPEFVLRRFGIK